MTSALASAKLTNLTDSIESKLISLLVPHLPSSSQQSFGQTTSAALTASNTPQLITLILPSLKYVLCPPLENVEELTVNDINSIYAILNLIITRLPNTADQNPLLEGLIETLTNTPLVHADQPQPSTKVTAALVESRLLTLLSLLNLSQSSEQKIKILPYLIKYASDMKSLSSINDCFTNLDENLTSWGASNEQRRSVYVLCGTSFDNEDKERRQYFNVQFLKSYATAPVGEGEKAFYAIAESALKHLVEAPLTLHSKCSVLLDSSIYSSLKTNTATKHLTELLSIYTSGDIDAYNKFKSTNANVTFTAKEDRAIKLLSLSTLGLTSPTHSLTYAQIAESLNIQSSEVESWIVALINASPSNHKGWKINQLASTVATPTSISGFSGREMTMDDWKDLKRRVDSLKGEVGKVVEGVKGRREELVK